MPFPDCYRCCAAFRPRYKRLVDNIYPVNPQDGLLRANLDKLIFFACSSPEKLDRIGEYLAQRVNRDIYRRRYAFIHLSMDAMDQLLMSCHARTLNLYLESFLKTIESLLESDASELKVLASQSFFRFANIEEDMPSYHRRYAFFVQSFSHLAHSVDVNMEVRNRLRVAGLKGIQGVVRKTCSEDLTESIWNSERMNLIIPSLLFNMQESRPLEGRATPDFDSCLEQNNPPSIAEACLCDIVKRTSFSNIKIVLQPVLNHLDNHGLWVPNHFAVYAFQRIMYTIPVQLSYTVIELIMGHLEANRDQPDRVKIQINHVLAQAITIATADGAGPSVLMIVNGLLKQLSNSVANPRPANENPEEEEFKDGIIETLADFARRCPDFQKNEILGFVMGKIRIDAVDAFHKELQVVLLEAVLRVAENYRPVQLNSIFQSSLVETLLQVLIAVNVETRLLAHKIVQSLLDRQQNLEKVRKISFLLDNPDLSFASPVRYDVQFFRKHGKDLLEACEESLNLPQVDISCIEAIYMTHALMIIEISCDETAADLVNSILSLQDAAFVNKDLDAAVRNCLYAVSLCLLGLLSLVLKLEELQNFSRQLATTRSLHSPDLLPTRCTSSKSSPDNIPPECLFDRQLVAGIFKSVGWESTHSKLTESSHPARYSYADSSSGGGATVDASGVAVELDTPSGSPMVVKRSPTEDISFATFKKILSEPVEKRREAKREKWNEMAAFYRTATFSEMMERQEAAKYQRTPGIPVYSFRRRRSPDPFDYAMPPEEVGSYAIKFPDVFMN